MSAATCADTKIVMSREINEMALKKGLGVAVFIGICLQLAVFWNTAHAIYISPPGSGQFSGSTKIRQLLETRHFREVLKLAQTHLQDKPDDGEMLAILGYAQAGLGDWRAARWSVTRAIQLVPAARADPLRLLLANILLDMGDSKEAERIYQALLARDATNTKALLGLGLLFRRTNDLPRAVDYFQRVLRIEPEQETALRALIQIHMERRDYPAIARVAKEIPAGSPSKGLGYYFEALALIRREQPDYHAAVDLLEKALDVSSSTQVLYTLGYVLIKEGRTKESVRRLKEAIALNPNFFEALKLLGIISLRTEQPKAASEYLEKALSIKKSPELHHLLGKAYLLLDRREEGVNELLKSLVSADLGSDAQFALEGLYRYIGGDLEQSEIALRESLKTTPNALDARILLIANLLKQGRFEGAARQARLGMDLHPNLQALLLNLLAQAKLGAGDLEEAEKALLAALESDPGAIPARLNLSGVYFRKGQYSKAEAELKNILMKDPLHVQTRLRLGRVYQATANYNAAERVLRGPKGDVPPAQLLLRELVLLKIREREHMAALEYARIMITKYPSLFDGFLLQSQVFASLGRAADAIESLDTGLQKAGDSRKSLGLAAKLARVNGWHEKAVHYLQRHEMQFGLADPVLKKLYATELIELGSTSLAREVIQSSLSPADPDTAFLLAKSYIADGDQVKAEEYIDSALESGVSAEAVEKQRAELRLAIHTESLEEALQSKPDDPARYHALAEAHEFLGDFDAAIETYKRGAAKTRRKLLFHTQMARIYLKKGDTGRAIELADDVLGRLGKGSDPAGDVEFRAYAVLGMSWARRQDTGKAEAALEHATREGSRLATAFYQLAKIKLAKGDAETATKLLRSAIGIEPTVIRYYLALAQIYQRSGLVQKSAAVYEEGLAANIDSIPLLNNVALLYLSLGEYQNALTRANRALELAPQEANVLDTVGWVHLQTGNPEKAVRYLERAVDRDSKSSLYRYHLGFGYFKMGAVKLAKRELEEALNHQAHAPWTQEVKRVLATIASQG